MPRRITVAAAGDALITTRMPDYPDEQFQRMCRLIQSADVAFINMEMILSNYEGVPVVDAGGGNLSAHPGVALDLMRIGFNLTAFANNHTLNYGEYGCLKTLEVLAEYNFACAGAGRHLAEARRPVYLDTPAGRVGLMGCAASFGNGQQAGLQKHDTQGRPGLNPQRFETLFVVDQEHMDAVRRIAERTGVEGMRQEEINAGWMKEPKREGEFPFAGRSFIVGEEFGIRTIAHEKDLEGNAASVRQAAAVSHLALASIHAHEQGKGQEDPADFLVEFAHAMIDAGAGMVIGHGHHAMRGLEIYNGKPIFYSLGDFIFQVELLRQIPADDYDGLSADYSLDAGEVFRSLWMDQPAAFGNQRKYWETVLPLCVFEDGVLTEITLHPLTLGFGQPLPDRGTPRLATGQLALEILETFAALSAPFGTQVEIDGEIGRVAVG